MTRASEVQVRDSVDHLFRHHAGQMVSVLCRIFGFDRIDTIEDAVQDALIAALRKWSFTGIPVNPTAWLMQAARNRMIDVLRRDKRSEPVDENFDLPDRAKPETAYFPGEMSEDQLRMIFACCHPSIAPDSQVALTLKTVGGFSVTEIASAYLSNEEAVAKMLTRAKARLRESGVSLDIPVAGEVTDRLDVVLKVLYLIFNEGYGASAGNELLRRDLCFEAIRLVEILSRHPLTALPKVRAAAALFLFQAARFPARTDHTGELVLLPDQDRELWDRDLAARGLRHLRHSASGAKISTFHLEAEIAGIYTLAESYQATDWKRILDCYDTLREISFSRIAELNRAVVVGQIDGAEAGLAALESCEDGNDLGFYNLFHITRAHLLSNISERTQAKVAYQTALSLTKNESVRRFIERRLAEL